ncbi:MAG: hypothetical protein ACLRPC_00940 [Streptococcus sp.]
MSMSRSHQSVQIEANVTLKGHTKIGAETGLNQCEPAVVDSEVGAGARYYQLYD